MLSTFCFLLVYIVHIRLQMHPRLQPFPFYIQYTVALFKHNLCTHACKHTPQITLAGKDYDYYWNKNTHFYLTVIPTLCSGLCLT